MLTLIGLLIILTIVVLLILEKTSPIVAMGHGAFNRGTHCRIWYQ
ncbi:hypothetical protein [Bacillus atrophaeus]|nr:hypothetical protein [Bacillus atrophaeus]